MNNNEYLNEEQYQKTNKKVSLIGKILLIVGGISFIVCTVLLFGRFVNNALFGLIAVLMVFNAAALGIGVQLFLISHQRKISAYMVQQQIPVAKEGIEKMSPSVGIAAKKIAQGVKEGLKDGEE